MYRIPGSEKTARKRRIRTRIGEDSPEVMLRKACNLDLLGFSQQSATCVTRILHLLGPKERRTIHDP